jgi:hypothetical protein
LQISVNDAVYIPDLGLRAMVFDHSIRLQDVGTNLGAEVDIEFGILDLSCDLALLLHFELVELRSQHAHGAIFVLVLRAFILAGRDESGGEVRDAHR